jgi:hypothetical protein
MFMREKSCEGWQWILNMVVHGMDGVLMRFTGCMGLGYGRISGGAGYKDPFGAFYRVFFFFGSNKPILFF